MTNKNDQIEISTLGKLAAHVPDIIVYGDFAQEMPFIESFDGVLLFMDISGFTALTEKFSMNTSLDRGADELTQTLNHYVGDIVEEVLVFGGDVLKFAGDALLALWKVERCHLNEIITLALKCSFSIQQEYGVRDTEVGLELRVKIGLSAGHISKVVIGDNRRQHFVVTGRAVEEVRLAQNLAKASEIILSPNCWELCDRNLIEVEKIKNERAVKVKYIRNVPDFDTDEFFDRCADYLNQNHICDSFEILRTASMLGPDEELEKRLRKYVMKNVLKKIDDNQPLEYLSELRPVTTVFVNMQFEENANTHHVCKAIQDANAMISGTILPLSGNINKVFMFDKGCTFLCIFGLPGDKQADESTNALDSAHKIHAFCSTALMKVKIVSIGVTGGPVFCGVVGHRVRHEYTVIGRKVNLAARMMMFYPGLVSCDALTYSKSKLPHYFFEELPLVEMKGVVNPGTVYQFLGITEKAMIYKAYLTKERSELYPLLGRKKETDIFENLLEKFKETKISHVIIYEGLMGYGKSQLVTEIAYLGQAPGQKVVAMELTKINAWQNFFAVRTLMAMFLGVDVCKTYDARQYILLSKLRGVIEEQYLCLFNNLFHVKFPTSEVVSQMDNDRKNKEIETMLLKILINAAEKEVLIFAIDEAQFIDKASWDFLDNLLKNVPIFVVMALSPINHKGRTLCSSATQILNSPSTTFIKLRELSPSIIIQKACQDLGVVSITRELETFLIQRSHGNPFYCEELLRNLHLNNVLQFHVLEEDEEKEDEWDSLFTTTVLKTHASKMLDEETELYICTVRQNVKLTTISLPPTLKGIALAALDNMNPSEQMVVKCAAVIGVTFTTEMLLYILPEWTKRKMYQTLAALVESRIFKCCTERKEVNVTQHMLSKEFSISNNELKSHRPESDLGSVISNRLKLEEAVMHCKIMEFCAPLLQEAAYELWLKNQKKALHFKCASYLKWLAHRCKCCGEGDFIPYHRYAVDGMLQKFYSQEDKIKNIKEDVLNEAAVILVSETLKKLEASHQEGRWATPLLLQNSPLLTDYQGFWQHMRHMYEDPIRVQMAARHLKELRQEKRPLQKFISEFQLVCLDSNWNDTALMDAFQDGLSDELQDELVRVEPAPTLDALVVQCIAMDLRKVEALCSWKPPHRVKDVQRLLGFANYYRTFIPSFAKLTAPADSITLFPCAYYSRKLTPSEHNYTTWEKELLAIKGAFETWRHHLEGARHKVEVWTDHRNLEHLSTARKLNQRQIRWSLFFARFNFFVTYIPSGHNRRADALSCKPEYLCPEDPIPPRTVLPAESLAIVQEPVDLQTQVREVQRLDAWSQQKMGDFGLWRRAYSSIGAGSQFWKSLMTALQVQVCLSSAHHPETDGDILRSTFILQESFRAENSELEFLKRMDEIILLTGMSKKRTETPGSQDCECKEIVESVTVPLSQHYLALGDYSRAFYYLLESASAYVNHSHNYMAFTYLNTAENLLRSSEFKHKLINQFEVSILYSLKGEVCYNMGQITSAKKLLKKALSLLKKTFPITVVGAFCMFMVETSKHLSHQNKQTLWQISSGREKRLAILFQQGHCLSLLWQLFNLDVARNKKTFTRLAALMQVNCAEESQDESQIISSYMDFSLCYQMMGCQHEWMKYELMAIKRSSHLQVVGGGLLTIAKLASSLAYMKLCLGNMLLAIQLGYRAHELYEQLKMPNLDANVLHDIFKALYLSTRYQDSVQVLSCLEDLTFRDDNIIGQSLFISGCLNIILYAGFCFKPFKYCQDFILANETNCILMSQNNIMLSLYSSLAIWFARLQQWDKFIIPFEKARRLLRRTSASLCSNHGFCKLVECETLLLRKYIEERPDKVREMHNRITKNLDQIMNQCSISPVYYSRVYHLKAYVQLMLGNDELSQNFIEKGFYSSDIYGNRLERSWLEISKEWWFTGKKLMEDFWLKAVPDFPVWNVNMTAQEMGAFHKNMYLLKVPELDINNQFPESSIEE
ncbi:adenylate cyclase type 10 [Notechis scutatus]|uniref:Adenylate cyclase type 10 n=1 Tax=Notechis scutatus TaxID=8663 RepID=A0A6J1VCK3_9SAUR|nr:adenylate cyclase type 10 [Notechis scutatus]